MKQYRFAILGKFQTYLSYFLMGVTQGAFLNGGLARNISLEKNSMGEVWEQIDFFKPHAIVAHTIFDNKPHRNHLFEILRKSRSKGCRVFYHAGDARPTPRFNSSISDIVDGVLLNHWPMMPAFSVWNVPCYHWPYMALNQDEIDQPTKTYECDLAFTGSLENNQHHAPRGRFIQQLKSVIPIKCFPTPESGNTRFQTPELAASAKAVLGFQMGLDVQGYTDVRPMQYAGAGAVYMQDKHSYIDRLLEDGVHYVSFKRDDIGSFMEKYKEFGGSAKIRKQGFIYCQQHHSSKERVRQIINILEGKEYKIQYVN